MNAKPTILLVIPNLGGGGAQRVFHQHREFLSDDFNVISCVFNFNGAFAEDKKADIISLDVPASLSLTGKLVNFFRRVKRLKKIKRDHKVDLTISHLEGADYVNVLSRQTDKTVLWIHGSKTGDKEITGVIGWFRRNVLIPWLYRRADKIVSVSFGIAGELKSLIPSAAKRISTVQNGISIEDVRAKSLEPLAYNWTSLLSKYFVIVTHCRFAPPKNLRLFLKIAEALNDMEHVRFVLIGDGVLRQDLLKQCDESGISNYNPWTNDDWTEQHRVFFAGRQMNPFPWLRNSSLYLLTSSWEGFPLSLCEAVVCGLPVVANDCHTGPKEILGTSHAGLLIPPTASVNTWVTSLRNVVADSATLDRYRKNAAGNANLFSDRKAKRETVEIVKQGLS
jgi:glycosyltransferase involved in cell wall biosynthesis